MFTFFILLFLVISLGNLIQGDPITPKIKRATELHVEKVRSISTGRTFQPSGEDVKVAGFILLYSILAFVEILVLITALSVDPLKIPTVLMILWFLSVAILARKNRFTEEDSVETLSGALKYKKFIDERCAKSQSKFVIRETLALTYYTYMTIALCVPYLPHLILNFIGGK